MKKAAVLLLAAGLVFGAAHKGAQAADIKVSGEWDFNTEWNNIGFAKEKTDDLFHARQRLRTQVDIIASESLKGTVFFEVGDTNWGNSSEGGALGTDGKVVEVRYSYVDWVVPQTDLRVRMGLQPFSLPNFVAGDPIMGSDDSDGAGITLSTQFTKNIGATLFWLRAENDNTDSATDYGKQYHYSDAMDFTGITLPLKFDGVKVTPWAMYGFVGRDSFENAGASGDQKKLLQGLLPLGVSNKTLTGNSLTDRHGDAWWAGFTTELKVLDPFRFALDATYGRVDLGEGLSTKGKKIDVKREGWIVSALAEYKMESVTPGLTAWYSSGDDANVNNGSERLPTINPDVKVTSYGFDGTNFCRAQQVLGTSVDGTFGIVGHLKDISFFEDLSHTLRVAFYRGTNNTENVRQKMITKPSETVSSMYYMTTADKAWEANVDSEYKIYKNLSLFLELGYIRMDLDSNVWKDYESKKNNFKGAVCVLYSF